MSTTGRRFDDKKRHKSRQSRRRPSAHSSGSEPELGSDEDQVRAYEPTSPAQWSPRHRHSTTSTISARLHVPSSNGTTTAAAAQRTRRLSPIDRLPPELLIHIFRQLTDTSHLYACLFVSSLWCQCVVEFLWLKPHLSTQASLLSFLSVLKPGFNPNAPTSGVPDEAGELGLGSSEGPVNGRRKSREHVRMPAIVDAAAADLSSGKGKKKEWEEAVEPLFPYTRFVRRLNLAGVTEEMQDAHFMCLEACTRLERLTLNGCIHLTDASLSTVIAHMHQLVALDLTGVIDVTDATIQVVATTSKRLQGINLEGCKKITDVGIYAIANHCPLLRRIKLCELEFITGRSVSTLVTNCPLLIEIDLNLCVGVGVEAARDIWSKCFHLRELRLAQCTLIGDEGFPVPAKVALPGSSSNFSDGPSSNDRTLSRVTFAVLPPLLLFRPLVHLRQLDLMSLHITDDAVAGIIVNAPKLRNLVLAKCSHLTDRAVRSIAGLGRHLQFLHLGHATSITDESIVHLARTCVRLRYVDLACCTSLTNESVRALSALPKLRRIGLVRVMNLTDQAVEYLTARHSTLERVHLSYCEQITVKAIHLLLQRLNKLTHLSLTGVPAFRKRDLQRFCRHPPSNFNELQRAAFCVYSGAGIQNLRKHLESIAPKLHEYGQANLENDEDGVGVGHGASPFGDPQLSDTDDEGDDRDLSSHFLLPHHAQGPASIVNPTIPSPVTPSTNTSNTEYRPLNGNPSSAGAVTSIDTRQAAPQLHALHLMSRTQASPGTPRQRSRGQENGTSNTRANSRQTLPGQVPEAYAGLDPSSSQAGRGVSAEDGSVTGVRHRSTMGGALANPVVGALMHSRLQRSVAREEQQRSQAPSSGSPTSATATGSDGRRGFARWIASGSHRESTPSGGIDGGGGLVSRMNGLRVQEVVEIPVPAAVSPSSSTAVFAGVRGVYAVAEANGVPESSLGEGEERESGSKRGSLEEEGVREEASAALCVYHETASGRSTPVRNANVESGSADEHSQRSRREKDKDKGPSAAQANNSNHGGSVGLALDELQDPSRTSTPSPSPSSRGVRRKLRGFNAAAVSLFRGKDRKT